MYKTDSLVHETRLSSIKIPARTCGAGKDRQSRPADEDLVLPGCPGAAETS